MVGYGWLWLKMSGPYLKCFEAPNNIENGWKGMEMGKNGMKGLEMTKKKCSKGQTGQEINGIG